MIEIKYFKNIHVKMSNQNTKALSIDDACLYVDKNNNRYCFVTFKNLYAKPLFSLFLHIKQYDQTGQFLKEGKFYIPDCYHPRGSFEIDEPFAVDKECDAVEIYVQKAVFSNKGFYNDGFVDVKSLPSTFEPKQPVYIPESSTFEHTPIESKPLEEVFKPQDKAQEDIEIKLEDEQKKEPTEVELSVEEPEEEPAPMLEVPDVNDESVVNDGMLGNYKKVNKFTSLIVFAVGIAVLILILAIIMSSINEIYYDCGLLNRK